MRRTSWGSCEGWRGASGRLPWFFLLVVLIPAPAVGSTDGLLTLTEAQFVFSVSDTPPPDNASWQPQTLPDNWNLSRPGRGGLAWYRLSVDIPPEISEMQAVYLARASMNAAVYLNGRPIGNGGRFAEPVARNWNRPLFYLIPPDLLRAGTNVVHVKLYVFPDTQGGLSPVRIGPEQVLRPVYENRFFWRIIVTQSVSVVVAAMGVLILALWWQRPAETMYGYFGAAALAWWVSSLNLYVRDIPVPTHLWEVIANASHQVFTGLLGLFVLRYLGLRKKVLERGLWALMVVAIVSLSVSPPVWFLTLSIVWHALTLILLIVVWVLLVKGVRTMRKVEAMLLAVAGLVNVGLGAHDLAVHANLMDYERVHLLEYGAPFLCFVIGWMLTSRFAGTLNAFEQLNAELEQRVTDKQQALEQSFLKLKQIEQERAVLEERERIMREMHDGVGANLMSGLTSLNEGRLAPDEVAAVLRECLDDVRLVVDSLAPTEQDLLAVLGNLRYRLEGRLTRQGIRLDWRVSDLPPLASLTPQTVLHILRILQEAFSNILKHARADTVVVETGVADPATHVFIKISDNGRGFPSDRTGRGLSNMRERAGLIGGTLDIQSGASGTSLTLQVPLVPLT